MNERTPKTYVPASSAKEITTDHGLILKLSFRAKELCDFAKAHANDKGWLNLCVTERRETGKYGETHSVWLDTWKPRDNPDAGRDGLVPKRGIDPADVPPPVTGNKDDVPF